MTTHAAAVGSDASYREMAALLRAHRVSGLPVVDAEGIVVGVESEPDLLTELTMNTRSRRRHTSTGELTITMPGADAQPCGLHADRSSGG